MTNGTAPNGVIQHPLTAIGSSVPWLRDRLEEHNVRLRGDSSLERCLATLDDFRDRMLNRGGRFSVKSIEQVYDYMADANGADFVTKALHAGVNHGLSIPSDWWASLASGDPNVFRGASSTLQRNTVWELVIAAIAAHFTAHVTFDEPDIRFDLDGKAFAVAAKVAYSEQQLWRLVRKGYKQSTAVGTDVDIVFVNVVRLLPTVELIQESRHRGFVTGDEATEWATKWAEDWCEGRELRKMLGRLEAEATRPVGIVFFMPMLLWVEMPLPFFYVHTPLTTEGPDYDFAQEFLYVCNHILGPVES